MTDDEHRALLAANAAFYRAFAQRDYDSMDRLWARGVEVACGHPGWRMMIGRERIMQSWRRILSNPAQGTLEAMEPRVIAMGATALVLCYERADNQLLAATNVFLREDDEWRLVHHQASHVLEPLTPPPPSDRPAGPLH